jgi:hypothetical protein
MLVHRINHPVAKSPQEKQRADQTEGEYQVFSVILQKEAILCSAHGDFILGLPDQILAKAQKFLSLASSNSCMGAHGAVFALGWQ